MMVQPPGRACQSALASLMGLGLLAAPAHGGLMEVGTIDPLDEATTGAVSFEQDFKRTPLVFTMPTAGGNRPRSVRVQSADAEGFTAAQTEPINSNPANNAGDMTAVPYLAIEPGRHTLQTASGTPVQIEAFNVHTQQTIAQGSGGYDRVEFRNQSFDTSPAVLAKIQSTHNETGNPPTTPSQPWMTGIVNNVQVDGIDAGNGDGFDIALERAEATSDGNVTTEENIAYIAIEVGTADVKDAAGNDVAFEASNQPATIDGIDDDTDDVAFSQNFDAAPIALAVKTSRRGNNGGWMRRFGLSKDDITLAIEEDQVQDNERSHVNEQAAILAFARMFGADLSTMTRTITWQGQQAGWRHDPNWRNWDGDPINLLTGDTLIFDNTGSGQTTSMVNNEHEGRLAEWRFAGSTAYTINAGASGRLHFMNDATIDNRTNQTQTINVPLTAHGQTLNLDTGQATTGELVLDNQANVNMIDDGTLNVLGDSTATINSTITGNLINQATLQGTGMLGDGDDTVMHQAGATFAPGQSIGTIDVGGDLVHADGSTLAIEIDASVDPIVAGTSHDQVNVTGEATLADGITIAPTVQNPAQLEEGDSFVIIDAQGGVNAESTVTAFSHNGLGLVVPRRFTSGDQKLSLLATYDVFSPRARGQNNLAVAGALGELAATNPPASVETRLLDPLRNTASDRVLNQALRELNATPYDALADIDREQTYHFMRTLGQHMLRMRQGRSLPRANGGTSNHDDASAALPMLASRKPSPRMLQQVLPGNDRPSMAQAAGQSSTQRSTPALFPDDDEANRLRTFGQAFGTVERQQRRPRRPGYVARTQGGLVGIDYQVSEKLFAGMSLSVSQTQTHFAQQRGSADTETIRLGPHVSYQQGPWFVDGGISYGYHDYDTKRNVPTLGETLTSGHAAHDVASFARLGMTQDIDGWRVTPIAALRHVYYHAQATRESSSPAALKLGHRDVQALSTRLAARVTKRLRLGQATLWPEASVGWSHQFLNDDDSIDTRFAAGGGPFTLEADESANDALVLGAGLSALLKRNTSAYVSYQGKFAHRGETHTLTAGLSFDF